MEVLTVSAFDAPTPRGGEDDAELDRELRGGREKGPPEHRACAPDKDCRGA